MVRSGVLATSSWLVACSAANPAYHVSDTGGGAASGTGGVTSGGTDVGDGAQDGPDDGGTSAGGEAEAGADELDTSASEEDGEASTTAEEGSTTSPPENELCEDADGDGYGNPDVCSTDPPEDWVNNAWDCNDDDPYLGPCPETCPATTGQLSCSGDIEGIGSATAPECPESDLVYDSTPGPGDYAIITAANLQAQWFGHGLNDHTTGTSSGQVFYGDLSTTPVMGSAYWREVLPVETNTSYMVHLWIKNTATNDVTSNEPLVGIRVNGYDVFDDLTVPNYLGDPDHWDQISVMFQSEADTQLTVEVVNWSGPVVGSGLDIAIDDVTIVGCG